MTAESDLNRANIPSIDERQVTLDHGVELGVMGIDPSSVIANSAEESINISLRDQLWVHPARVMFRSTKVGQGVSSLGDRIVETRLGKATTSIGDALAEDILAGSHRGTATLGTFAIAAEILDRRRIIVEVMPPKALHRMEAMHFDRLSSLAAAAVFSTGFAIWTFGSSEVLNRAIERYPQLTERLITQFPRVTKLAQDAIPKKPESTLEPDATSGQKIKNALSPKQVFSGFKRGLSAGFLGTTIFVGTAAAEGKDRKERTKINAEVSAKATASMFVFVAGVAEAIRQSVLNNSPETAQRIMANAESDTNWNIASWAVILGTIGLNWIGRKNVDAKQAKADAQKLAKNLERIHHKEAK